MPLQAAADFYFRIAGGFINASLTPENALPHPITLVAHPSAVADRMFDDYIRSSGAGAIVVEQAREDKWAHNFPTALGMRGTSVGGVTIYPSNQTGSPVPGPTAAGPGESARLPAVAGPAGASGRRRQGPLGRPGPLGRCPRR